MRSVPLKFCLALLIGSVAGVACAAPEGPRSFAAAFRPAETTGRGCVGDWRGPLDVRLLVGDRPDTGGYLTLNRFNVYRARWVDATELRFVWVGAKGEETELGALKLTAPYEGAREELAGRLSLRSIETNCEFAGELRLPREAGGPEAAGLWERLSAAAGIQRDGMEVRTLEVAGRHADALARAQAVVARSEATFPPRDANIGHALRRQASVLWSMGRYTEAAAASERAVALLRDSLGAEALETAHAANDLGLIYRDSGRQAEALPLLAAAFEASRRGLGEQHVQTARLLYNLSLVYEDLYRFEEALPGFERVYLTRSRALGEDDRVTLRSREPLANVLRKMGRRDEAVVIQEETYRTLLAKYGPEDLFTLHAKGHLGSMLVWAGVIDRGLALEREAYAAFEARLGPWHWNTMQRFVGVAGNLILTKRLDEAERLLTSRLDAARAAPDVSPDFLYRLHGLMARLHSERRQWSDAVSSFDAAVEIARTTRTADHPIVLGLQAQQATALAGLGRRDEAIGLLERWVESTEASRASGGFGESYRQTLLAGRHREYRELAELYAEAGRTDDAFRTVELLKARSLLDTLATRNALEAAGIGADADQLTALGLRIGKLNEQIARARPGSDERLQLEALRGEAEREVQRTRQALIAESPKARAMMQLDTIDAQRAARLLRPDEAAVSYLLAERRAYALVITPARPVRLVDLGPSYHLAGAIEALSELLSKPGAPAVFWRTEDGRFVRGAERPSGAAVRVQDWQTPARALGEALVQPLLPMLRGRSAWFIAPDTGLAHVPFDAMLVEGRPLVERATVVNVQSLSVLAAIRARPARPQTAVGRVLAVGGPEYEVVEAKDAASARQAATESGVVHNLPAASTPGWVDAAYRSLGARWDALPGSRDEALAVRDAFARHRVRKGSGTVDLLLGRDASEARLQELDRSGALRRYRYLHFATHGYLHPDAPPLSAVVLSLSAATPEADGYVTAAEWAGYSLDSELIVLSACETGRGRQLPGEGVLGLPYAMFVAGNRAAVLTQWKIDDASASRFVAAFFARVAGGAAPRVALTETKREFLRSGRWSHPSHWAAFVIYGD